MPVVPWIDSGIAKAIADTATRFRRTQSDVVGAALFAFSRFPRAKQRQALADYLTRELPSGEDQSAPKRPDV